MDETPGARNRIREPQGDSMFEEMVASLQQPGYCEAPTEHAWLLVWPAGKSPRWSCVACQARENPFET